MTWIRLIGSSAEDSGLKRCKAQNKSRIGQLSKIADRRSFRDENRKVPGLIRIFLFRFSFLIPLVSTPLRIPQLGISQRRQPLARERDAREEGMAAKACRSPCADAQRGARSTLPYIPNDSAAWKSKRTDASGRSS
eukprot:scaffold803_cov310-Pinguiococcus_pyrenoidosus.AAC.33